MEVEFSAVGISVPLVLDPPLRPSISKVSSPGRLVSQRTTSSCSVEKKETQNPLGWNSFSAFRDGLLSPFSEIPLIRNQNGKFTRRDAAEWYQNSGPLK